jgi:glycosyltransferase involved in cell wall biosynthesis
MKVALVCSGLEHVQRGYESFSIELYKNYNAPEFSIDLIKGSGTSHGSEYSVWCIKRTSVLLSWISKSDKGKYLKYKIEGWTLAIGFLPYLLKRRYRIIHTSDNEFGKAIKFFRRVLKLNFRILFSNGAPWEAHECSHFDMVQEVTQYYQLENIKRGLDPGRSVYVPYGINCQDFSTIKFDRLRIRKELGIPEQSFVVLSLSALKITHKRLDYLIKEFQTLKKDFFLVMSGGEDDETPQLKNLASSTLGKNNYVFLSVRYNEVIKLLACSDILVSTSLSEAFGRVLIEGAAARVPVLSHDHYSASEVLGHPKSKIDMNKPGALSEAIQSLRLDPKLRDEMVEQNFKFCKDRFDWTKLVSDYSKMYEETRSVNEN